MAQAVGVVSARPYFGFHSRAIFCAFERRVVISKLAVARSLRSRSLRCWRRDCSVAVIVPQGTLALAMAVQYLSLRGQNRDSNASIRLAMLGV
jgi:hypothetical protein